MHGGVPSRSDRDNERLTAGIHHTITVYFQQIPSLEMLRDKKPINYPRSSPLQTDLGK